MPQGFETIEYTASALLDQAMHKLTAEEISVLDLTAFEEKELGRLGMPKGIVMRHRPAHFQRKMNISIDNFSNCLQRRTYCTLFDKPVT